MTAKERVTAALEQRPTDRPPHSSIENIKAMCDIVRNYRNPLFI